MTEAPERVWVWPDMGAYDGEECCVNSPLALDPCHSADLVEYIRADLAQPSTKISAKMREYIEDSFTDDMEDADFANDEKEYRRLERLRKAWLNSLPKEATE